MPSCFETHWVLAVLKTQNFLSELTSVPVGHCGLSVGSGVEQSASASWLFRASVTFDLRVPNAWFLMKLKTASQHAPLPQPEHFEARVRHDAVHPRAEARTAFVTAMLRAPFRCQLGLYRSTDDEGSKLSTELHEMRGYAGLVDARDIVTVEAECEARVRSGAFVLRPLLQLRRPDGGAHAVRSVRGCR